MRPHWYQDRVFLVALAGSGALKLLLAFAVRHAAPILDEAAYLDLARTLAAGGGYEGTFRPPGYPAFLSLFLALGLGTLGVRLAQVGLSLASCVLVYRLGTRWGGEKVGRWAGIVFAFDPVLISFSHRLWSETLFITILLATSHLVTGEWPDQPRRRAILLGLLMGVGCLVRPMFITLLPLLGLWAVWEALVRRRDTGDKRGDPRLTHAGLIVATALVVILPWSIRNQRLTGDFVLIDSNGAFNFLVGAQPETRFVDKDDRWSEAYGTVDGEPYTRLVARDAARAQEGAMAQAWGHIGNDPKGFVEKCLWEAAHLWTLDSFLLRHLRNGWYGKQVPRVVIAGLTLLSVLYSATLVLTGLAGILLRLSHPMARLCLLVVLHGTLLFAATYALSRYALPMHPFLALGAAGFLAGGTPPGERWRTAAPWARVVLIVALGLVSLSWMRDLPLMGDMLRHGGVNHQYRFERLPPSPERP